MPQKTSNVADAIGHLWKPEEWAIAVEVARDSGFFWLREGQTEVTADNLLMAVVYAVTSPAARNYHRREFIADGFIYDPEAGRIYDLVADALPPARPPATDLIDGFDFEGMDWGEDEKPAA